MKRKGEINVYDQIQQARATTGQTTMTCKAAILSHPLKDNSLSSFVEDILADSRIMQDIDASAKKGLFIADELFNIIREVPLASTQNRNTLPDHSLAASDPTKGIAPDETLYKKAPDTACEPYKHREGVIVASNELENVHESDLVFSSNTMKHGLSLISEPLVEFRIKAATNYMSKNIGKWKVRSFPLTGHHFWLLVKIHHGQEIYVEAIHGLSTIYETNEDGNTQAYISSQGFETWNSKLKVYCVLPPKARLYHSAKPFIRWIEPNETFTQHYDKLSKKYVLNLWNHIRHSVKDLNKAEIPYSFCGLGKSLGMMSSNSNSAYASIAYIMGIKPHHFKGVLAPGCNSTMLAKKDLQLLFDYR
jgi:hypothetical protein